MLGFMAPSDAKTPLLRGLLMTVTSRTVERPIVPVNWIRLVFCTVQSGLSGQNCLAFLRIFFAQGPGLRAAQWWSGRSA